MTGTGSLFDQPVADNIIAELSDFAHRAEANLYPLPAAGITQAKFNPDAPLASGYYFKELQMLEHPEFQRMLGDPLLLAVAHADFGCEPKLAYLAMWWSAVFVRTPLSDMAQLFHADLAHTKWLKTFVYLTDVDKGTGPTVLCAAVINPTKAGISCAAEDWCAFLTKIFTRPTAIALLKSRDGGVPPSSPTLAAFTKQLFRAPITDYCYRSITSIPFTPIFPVTTSEHSRLGIRIDRDDTAQPGGVCRLRHRELSQ